MELKKTRLASIFVHCEDLTTFRLMSLAILHHHCQEALLLDQCIEVGKDLVLAVEKRVNLRRGGTNDGTGDEQAGGILSSRGLMIMAGKVRPIRPACIRFLTSSGVMKSPRAADTV